MQCLRMVVPRFPTCLGARGNQRKHVFNAVCQGLCIGSAAQSYMPCAIHNSQRPSCKTWLASEDLVKMVFGTTGCNRSLSIRRLCPHEKVFETLATRKECPVVCTEKILGRALGLVQLPPTLRRASRKSVPKSCSLFPTGLGLLRDLSRCQELPAAQ